MTQPQVAIVTGGATGIGWSIAKELSDHGWEVVVGDLDEQAARRSCGQQSGTHPAHVDVTNLDSVQRLVDGAVRTFDRVDLMVNNAGITHIAPFEDFPTDKWDAVLAVDLKGVLFGMQTAGRQMLANGGGSIVNIASIAAERGTPGRAAYAASKAAVVSLTRTAAVEWASRGVRVNAVGPGYVMTDLIKRLVAAGEVHESDITAAIPTGRFAEPREIAAAVRFLGSQDASYITGQVLYVDGAFMANYGVTSHSKAKGSQPS